MAKLTKKERDRLPARDFALPDTRQFPIEDREHAEMALRMMGREPAKVQQEIKRAVHERYPDLGGPTRVITHGRNLAGARRK